MIAPTWDYSGSWQCSLGTVPAGKILVIESASCFATVPAGSGGGSMYLNMASPKLVGGPGYLNLNFFMTLQRTSGNASNDYYGQVTPLQLYAVGGFQVSVIASLPMGSHDMGCAISGHLVNQ